MNQTLIRIGQAVSHDRPTISYRCLNIGQRLESTNSAIYRGIRRSRDGELEERRQPRWDRTDKEYEGALQRQNLGSTRPRKPNHQQRQDVDEMEMLANSREGRLTPRQRRYLQGGTKDGANAPTSDRRRGGLRKHDGGDRTFENGSERTARYEGNRSPSRTSFTPDRTNRAGRRALLFNKDQDLSSKSGEPLYTRKEREYSFDDHSTSSGGAYFSKGEYSAGDRRVPYSSREGDSREPRGSFSKGEYRAGAGSVPYSPQGEDAGRDAERPTSFSNGGHRAGDRRFPHSSLGENAWQKPVSPLDRSEDRLRGSKTPLSIPYTTPASEFLYGTSVITAALRSSKRQLYKLYMYGGENREVQAQDASVRKLALARSVRVTRVERDWLRLMDKMSGGRPHNGYILEASPLPKLPVKAFQRVEDHQGSFHAILDHQSREEEAVNGTDPEVEYKSSFPRYPFVLMLDGILDPGNLGAILRTAYFLGVDAVAISNRNSAPFSPVALKASAGASEDLKIMSIAQPGAFIDETQKNGWKVYAAVAPSISTRPNGKTPTYFSTATISCPVRNHPCILMLGGEGEGLRWNMQKKADFVLGVEGNRVGQGGVDSLNVSVAAGLLCDAFLRRSSNDALDKGSSEKGHAEEGPRLF